MFLGFDKNDIKKGLGVIAEKSKDIAKMTVEVGKKGGALANEKLEEYSQRSQRAENVNVSTSEMKKYEKYAHIIIENIDDTIAGRIFKNVLYFEFAMTNNYILSYLEYLDDASEFENYIFKFIDDKWRPKKEEIMNERNDIIEMYKKIINDSSNAVQQFFGVSIDNNEYILISHIILDLTGKWTKNLEYRNKGSYLVKKVSNDTAKFLGDMFDSMVTSTVREADRRNKYLEYHIDEMTDEQREVYYNNQDNVEQYKEIINSYKEIEKDTSNIVPRILDMSIEELDNLQVKAGI